MIPNTRPCDQVCKLKIESTSHTLLIVDTAKIRSHLFLAAWVVGFLMASALKHSLILKCYAIHKTINFIPEDIILMIIKSFCVHILPRH